MLTKTALSLLFAALFAARAVAFHSAEDVGGTVMPFGLGSFGGDVDKIAERLREVKARGGILRFSTGRCGARPAQPGTGTALR